MEDQHQQHVLWLASGSSACRNRTFLQDVDFRQLSIIPSKEELFGQLDWQQLELPTNKVQGEKYDSISEYLATHFILLREDCMHSLCQGVQAMSQNRRPADRLDLRVYRDARLHSICCGKFGMEHRLSFLKSSRLAENSESSKCLREGSLVCMSDDGFDTLAWGIVSRHIKVSDDGVIAQIRCWDKVGDTKQLDYNRRYTMIESPPAFFEAYCHVLRNLQKPEMMDLPFGEHLVFLCPQVDAPDYLTKKSEKQTEYDFSCVFPEMENQLGSSVLSVLQQWPKWKSSLDPSQMEAVKHGITKRLALIQGPPGTGKTFVGKIIVNILLNNLWRVYRASSFWEQDEETHENKRIKLESENQMDCPLLVLCYTNHALDQFLELIFEFEQNLIRYGGRSTSSKLESCIVKKRIKQMKGTLRRSLWNQHRRLCREFDKLKMEISKCHAILQLDHVTFEPLCEVATHEQMERLYFCGPSPKVLQLWLLGLDMQSAYNCIMQGEEHEYVMSAANEAFSASVLDKEIASISGNFNLEEPYVWMLERSSRMALHGEWLKQIKINAEKKLSELSLQYEQLCVLKMEIDEEIQYSALKSASVVGMTTTAAARCHSILMRLKPKVIIVEEAAEIPEGHIVACLTPSTEHLILIGDHLQLRPSVAVNKLAADHNLDVSLFERLVSGGVEHVTLKYQRRMRPGISRLLRCIYPTLMDHDSVFGRKNVEGLLNNVFFLDHRSQERCVLGSRSKVNIEESLFVVELYLYILKQGFYKISDVTILTMYRAQVEHIKSLLQERAKYTHSLPSDVQEALLRASAQITCVDDFQGEESNIIILSLVRNVSSENDIENIGFLESSNRVCVALSRAREGLYIFGNADLLSSKTELWRAIVDDLRSANAIASFLTLVCPNHFLGLETTINNARDFEKVTDGGCGNKCDHRLECGHLCPRSCHPGGHVQVACPRRCLEVLPCGHRCMQKCHATTCHPCEQVVSQVHPHCGHRTLIACSRKGWFRCEEPCGWQLDCGHKCAQKCGQECTKRCTTRVDKTLPCGHVASVPCYQSETKYFCQAKCGEPLEPHCRHRCQGKCSSCKLRKVHPQCCKSCERVLPCGHQCKSLCYQTCQPCTRPCENACHHRRCRRKCGDLCQPCEEACEWNCEHLKCGLKCHQVCNRPRCNEKCPKLLKCGHDCIGLCGEPCPIRCRICNPDVEEICSKLPLKEMEASARFVELSDCGHLAEYNMLDAYIDMCEPAASLVHPTTWPKSCPKCKTPIRRTIRYRGVINLILLRLEESKKQIIDDIRWFSNS